jgi:hypothetical protein
MQHCITLKHASVDATQQQGSVLSYFWKPTSPALKVSVVQMDQAK